MPMKLRRMVAPTALWRAAGDGVRRLDVALGQAVMLRTMVTGSPMPPEHLLGRLR